MPDDANALIAQGIKPPPAPDFVGPLTALSQMAHAQAQSDLERAQTAQYQQTTQFAADKMASIARAQELAKGGMPWEQALQESGTALRDPAGVTSALANIETTRRLAAERNWAQDPTNPYRLAGAGPEAVSKAVGIQKTQAETAETQLKVKQGQAILVGQLGNMIVADPSPAGRQRVSAMAHALGPQLGISTDMIDRAMALPDDKWAQLGEQLVAGGQNAEAYARTSGREKAAELRYTPQRAGVNENIIYSPEAGAIISGRPAPAFTQPGAGTVTAPAAPAAPAAGAGAPAAAPAPAGAPAAAPASAAAPQARSTFTNPTLPIFAQNFGGGQGGFSPQGAAKLVSIESRGNPNAVAPGGKFVGLVQAGTPWWNRYGEGSPFDPAASLRALGRAGPEYARALEPILGRPPTDAELYVVHQQGIKGGPALFANPNARAGDIVGDAAIRNNGGNPNGTAKQFTDMWTARFQGTTPATSIAPFGGRTLQMPPGTSGLPPAPGIPGPDTTASWLLAARAGGIPAPTAPPLPVPQLAQKGPEVPVAPASAAAPAAPAPGAAPAAAAAPGAAPAAAAAPGAGAIPTIENPTGAAVPRTGLAADQAGPLLTPLPGGGMVLQGPTTEDVKRREHLGNLPDEYRKEADSAKVQSRIIDNALAVMPGWTQGRWAEWQQTGREFLQALYTSIGVPNKNLDVATGNYQAFVKDFGQLVREAVEEASPRGGIQVSKLYGTQLPNPLMDKYGIQLISEQFKGLNDFKQAQQQASDSWADARQRQSGRATQGSAPGTGGMSFPTFWNKHASIDAFTMLRMFRDNPAMAQDIANDMAKTPEGLKTLKDIAAAKAWIKANNLLQTEPASP